ncbi:MAG: virulence RhuM family protein [Bacteroidales bacterium]|nr:virulence RhuM family protein [Bacteroidales bacterium]
MVRTTIELNSAPYNGEVMLYQTADGRVSIDVILVNESVWLTQDQLAILFERDKSVISRHIKNVFSEGELDPKVVVAKNAITTSHGAMPGKTQTRDVIFYNLDVIISVGYRVKSKRGTQFRIWANSVLKEYLIQGYAVRNGLVQQRYNDLKALVDVMGRTMGYLDSPAGQRMSRKAAVQVNLQST